MVLLSHTLSGVVESEQVNSRDFAGKATKEQDLRYGGNLSSHQRFIRCLGSCTLCKTLSNFKIILVFTTILLEILMQLGLLCVVDGASVIVFEAQSPCGSATAENVVEAYDRAFACDPISAFGGSVRLIEVPLEFVEHFAGINKQFVEVLIAPNLTEEALERLSKGKSSRIGYGRNR